MWRRSTSRGQSKNPIRRDAIHLADYHIPMFPANGVRSVPIGPGRGHRGRPRPTPPGRLRSGRSPNAIRIGIGLSSASRTPKAGAVNSFRRLFSSPPEGGLPRRLLKIFRNSGHAVTAPDITILAEETAGLGGSHGVRRPRHHSPKPQHAIQRGDDRGTDGRTIARAVHVPAGMRPRSWRSGPWSSATGRWCSASAAPCCATPTMPTTPFRRRFLVLVRRAGSLWVRDSLGPWLHQVAFRTASCARSAAARRRQHELRAAEMTARPLRRRRA